MHYIIYTEINRRRWVDSCTHLWKCRIASSAESCMYVLAAKDFGLDVVDSLASGNSPPGKTIQQEEYCVKSGIA